MKSFRGAAATLVLLLPAAALLDPSPAAFAAPASSAQLTGFPFTDETLNYSVKWPSGLTLGEGHFTAKRSGADWNFEFSLDAGIPGYPVRDDYVSQSVGDFCSAMFRRTSQHGSRHTDEKETLDTQTSTVRRVTKDGGESTISAPNCLRDALSLLYFTRRELGQGRVPPAQQVLFGNVYEAQLTYAGAQMVPIGGKGVETDKVVTNMQGPSSHIEFEMYFGRDAARTPLLIKTTLAVGPFSMELTR